MSVRILQICSSLSGDGGVQSVLKNYYSHMDRERYQFDFIVQGGDIGALESWFEQYGSKIYHVTPRHTSLMKNTLEIASVIRKGQYDVVHCHQDYYGAISMAIAKHYGVPLRMIHSHRANVREDFTKRGLHSFLSFWLKHAATHFIGCGEMACKWAFGEDIFRQKNAFVLKNAIELDRFRFSAETRKSMREKLGLAEDAVVLGHIGRFTPQKNHRFLVEIFQEYAARVEDARLFLIGSGPLEQETAEQISALGLQDKVIRLGTRSDIPELLCAMDVLLLPSRFEGLVIVAIEAQANGLPVVCSENITKEIAVTKAVHMLAVEDYNNLAAWCAEIDTVLASGRFQCKDALVAAGYSIEQEAKFLEQLYAGEAVSLPDMNRKLD